MSKIYNLGTCLHNGTSTKFVYPLLVNKCICYPMRSDISILYIFKKNLREYYLVNNCIILRYIYVFHTWSFCAGRKTSTIGLFELFIIIICWIFCAYRQILSRDVEDFCVHAQKFQLMISNNNVFQHWLFRA